MIHPQPRNNRKVDRANENGNEVTPNTSTRLIWGLSSTEILEKKIELVFFKQKTCVGTSRASGHHLEKVWEVLIAMVKEFTYAIIHLGHWCSF